MRHTLAGVVLLVLSAAVAAPLASQSASLAGTWKLNPQESDDANQKLQAALEKGPTVVSGMREGGGRVRTGAGRQDRPESGTSDAAAPSSGGAAAFRSGPFLRIMRPAPQIVVLQTDTTIVINDEIGLPMVYYLDGRKVEGSGSGPEPTVTTARWKDGKLTVERKLPGVGSIKELYVMDVAKKRLVVETKVTSAQMQGTLELRRVYDGSN